MNWRKVIDGLTRGAFPNYQLEHSEQKCLTCRGLGRVKDPRDGWLSCPDCGVVR